MPSHDLTDLLADEIISYILEFLDSANVIPFASLSKRLYAIAHEAELYVFRASLYSRSSRTSNFKQACRAFSNRMELLNGAQLLLYVSISIDSDPYSIPYDLNSESDSDQQNSNRPRSAHPWTRAATAVRESMSNGSIVILELSLPVRELRDIEAALSLPALRLRRIVLRLDDHPGAIGLPHDLFAGHAPRLRSVVIGPLVDLPQSELARSVFSGVKTLNAALGPCLEGLELICTLFPAARHLVLVPDINRAGPYEVVLYEPPSDTRINQAVIRLPQQLRHLSLCLGPRESFAEQYISLAKQLYNAIHAHRTATNSTVPLIRLLLQQANQLLLDCAPTFASYFFGPHEPLAATFEPPTYSQSNRADCNLTLCLHRDSSLQARMEIVLGDLSWNPGWIIANYLEDATPGLFERIVCVTITVDWLEKIILRNWLQLPNLRTVRVVLTSYDVQLPEDVRVFRIEAPVLQVVLVVPDGLRRRVPYIYAKSIANRLRAFTTRPTQLETEHDSMQIETQPRSAFKH